MALTNDSIGTSMAPRPLYRLRLHFSAGLLGVATVAGVTLTREVSTSLSLLGACDTLLAPGSLLASVVLIGALLTGSDWALVAWVVAAVLLNTAFYAFSWLLVLLLLRRLDRSRASS